LAVCSSAPHFAGFIYKASNQVRSELGLTFSGSGLKLQPIYISEAVRGDVVRDEPLIWIHVFCFIQVILRSQSWSALFLPFRRQQ